MGLKGNFWDEIKNEEKVVPLAQLAGRHYKDSGRPLRIAVDAAHWWFNNLDEGLEGQIRKAKNQPYHREKNLFYRICRQLRCNVQLLFVFDGPRRPEKRGVKSQRLPNNLELFQNLLSSFKIPFHEAPGEAEAECALLEQLGVVDAVFSNDSDTLMFGSKFLISDHRTAKVEGDSNRAKDRTEKSQSSVQVVWGRDIQRKYMMTRESLVLWAIICGADYSDGIQGCGAKVALPAIRAGLGESLCQCETQADCNRWARKLEEWLQMQPKRSRQKVPDNFPGIQVLDNYYRPITSSEMALRDLGRRLLHGGWDRTIDEVDFIKEMSLPYFNIRGKFYLNWVGPIFLTKYLVGSVEQSQLQKNIHGIELVRRQRKCTSETQTSERKIRFSPFRLTSLKPAFFRADGCWTADNKELYDANHRVEVELPEFLLELVFSLEELHLPKLAVAQKQANEVEAKTLTSTGKKRHFTATTVSATKRTKVLATSSQAQLLSKAESATTPWLVASNSDEDPTSKKVPRMSARSSGESAKNARSAKSAQGQRPSAANSTASSPLLPDPGNDTPSTKDRSNIDRKAWGLYLTDESECDEHGPTLQIPNKPRAGPMVGRAEDPVYIDLTVD